MPCSMADVALPVVRSFTESVRRRAVGQAVSAALDPRQAFIKIVHEELVEVMGQANDALNLATAPPRHRSDGWATGVWQDHHGGQARALR